MVNEDGGGFLNKQTKQKQKSRTKNKQYDDATQRM